MPLRSGVPFTSGMRLKSLVRQTAAPAATVAIGLGLLAMSAAGFPVLDRHLRVAAHRAVLSDVVDHGAPYERYHGAPCRRGDRQATERTPEI